MLNQVLLLPFTPIMVCFRLFKNLRVCEKNSISAEDISSLLSANDVIDENSSPKGVKRDISLAVRALTSRGPQRKRITKAKQTHETYIFSGISVLPSVPDTPVNHDWFGQHLPLLSASLHRDYQCQSNPKFHIVEMSSPTRGHKAITIDLNMKTLTLLEVNGKPVNMDHLPVEVPQRYNSASEFLSILNFVANMSVCASRKSPSCTILMSRVTAKGCRKCEWVTGKKTKRDELQSYERGRSDIVDRIYKVGPEFGSYVEAQLRRNSQSRNATYDEK